MRETVRNTPSNSAITDSSAHLLPIRSPPFPHAQQRLWKLQHSPGLMLVVRQSACRRGVEIDIIIEIELTVLICTTRILVLIVLDVTESND